MRGFVSFSSILIVTNLILSIPACYKTSEPDNKGDKDGGSHARIAGDDGKRNFGTMNMESMDGGGTGGTDDLSDAAGLDGIMNTDGVCGDGIRNGTEQCDGIDDCYEIADYCSDAVVTVCCNTECVYDIWFWDPPCDRLDDGYEDAGSSL